MTGTNGILVPPDGYMQGVRELCTKHGILMICDEVMAGFGRTGEWFAIDHWKVVPDIITMAKGLTAAYVQLGAVGMRRGLAEKFNDKVFYGGLTYNSHPLACAAALAAIEVYEDDQLLENARRMGAIMKELFADLGRRHPSVGAARSIGLFGLVELVRDRTKKSAAGAVQRHVGRNGRARQVFSARKGSTRSCAGTRSSPTRRCASTRSSCARRSRSSIAASRSPTGRSTSVDVARRL